MPQATLARVVEMAGLGLHSGAAARVRLCPAPVDHGRVFVRMDLDEARVPALSRAVVDTRLATTLGAGPARVSTVEHLLAAAFALDIDNLLIQVWGPELPVLDGSALAWLEAMTPVAQGAPARVLRMRAPITHREGDRWVGLSPAERLGLAVAIHFEHPSIGRQSWQGGAGDFPSVASARTFGFEAEVQAMHQAGLGLGGSLENAVIFGEAGPLNALRFEDEPVRHKALDLFGDLALLGCRLQAEVRTERPGHALTHGLLQALWANPALWELSPE